MHHNCGMHSRMTRRIVSVTVMCYVYIAIFLFVSLHSHVLILFYFFISGEIMGISFENINTGLSVDYLLCSICSQLLYDTIVLAICKHMFCRECIEEWVKSIKSDTANTSEVSCPDCRKPFSICDVGQPVRIVQNLLKDITFKCPIGCSLIISYTNYFEHLKHCKMTRLNCNDWMESILSCEMDKHQIWVLKSFRTNMRTNKS